MSSSESSGIELADASPALRMSAMAEHFARSRDQDEKISLRWEGLQYSTFVKDSAASKPFKPVYKETAILSGVTGEAHSGQVLSIMGPSGSGKTSLLNVLSARVGSGGSGNSKLSGSIFVNGEKRDEDAFRKLSAYVLQEDQLYPHLTVLETLQLAAYFFLPIDTPKEAAAKLVDAVIMELNLSKARDVRIGDDKVRGVSGGERKRAAIAVQLIADPLVIFLDEPTSGLDSFQALSVMESIRSLASQGRLVVAVIHQPRSSIFNMCDQLLLIAGGRTVYFGKGVDASVGYFSRIGFQCPLDYNPSDYFMDMISVDTRSPEAFEASTQRISVITEQYAKYEQSVACTATLHAGTGISNIKTTGQVMDFKRLLRNVLVLGWRSFTEQSRNIVEIRIKLIISIVFGGILGGIYSNIGNSQKSIQNRVGLLFFVGINSGFTAVLGVLNVFPKEKAIVARERSARAYDIFSYFLAKVLVEIPLSVLPPVVYGCILYYIVGLNPNTFGYFLLILMLGVTLAISLGLWVSSFAPSPEAAAVIGPPLLIIGLLFGGYYINIDSLPIVANWIPYVSFMKWIFQALVVNEFAGLTFDCSGVADDACIKTGEQAINKLSFGGHSTAYGAFGMGMLLLGFLSMALFCLYFSKVSYVPLGFEGRGYRGLQAKAGGDQRSVNSTAISDSEI